MSRIEFTIEKHSLYDTLPEQMREQYDSFIQYLLGHQRINPETINRRIGGHVLRFLSWMHKTNGVDKIDNLGAVDAINFLTAMNPRTSTYAEKFKQSIHGFMKWAFVQGYLSADELMKFNMVKPKSRNVRTKVPAALKDAEIEILFESINRKFPYSPKAIDKYNRGLYLGGKTLRDFKRSIKNVQYTCLVMIALEMGLRRCELFPLTIHDIDPQQRSILIVGKANKVRTVPYPEGLKPYVQRWLAHRRLIVGDEHEMLWVTMHGYENMGKPVAYRSFEKWINTIYDKRIQEGWHKLRRTFGRTRYFGGMDIGILSVIMGHEDIKTTRIYLGLQDEDVVAESERLQDGISAFFTNAADSGRKKAMPESA